MFKFVIFSTLLAVAQADIDKFLGRAVTIAVSPNITSLDNGCDATIITKVNDSYCTCDNRTNVPLLSAKPESNINPGVFFAGVEIESFAEVHETVKTLKCECGDKEYAFLAFKAINDNYFAVYSALFAQEGGNILYYTLLNARTIPDQADLDKTISGVPELSNRTDYAIFCGLQ